MSYTHIFSRTPLVSKTSGYCCSTIGPTSRSKLTTATPTIHLLNASLFSASSGVGSAFSGAVAEGNSLGPLIDRRDDAEYNRGKVLDLLKGDTPTPYSSAPSDASDSLLPLIVGDEPARGEFRSRPCKLVKTVGEMRGLDACNTAVDGSGAVTGSDGAGVKAKEVERERMWGTAELDEEADRGVFAKEIEPISSSSSTSDGLFQSFSTLRASLRGCDRIEVDVITTDLTSQHVTIPKWNPIRTTTSC